MKPAFRICLNPKYGKKRRLWVDVYLRDVLPSTFYSWGGGWWAYYSYNKDRGRYGKFGELHFVKSRVREDVVAHELIHLLGDYLRSRGTGINVYNEESIAIMFDHWVRTFWREFRKNSLIEV